MDYNWILKICEIVMSFTRVFKALEKLLICSPLLLGELWEGAHCYRLSF